SAVATRVTDAPTAPSNAESPAGKNAFITAQRNRIRLIEASTSKTIRVRSPKTPVSADNEGSGDRYLRTFAEGPKPEPNIKWPIGPAKHRVINEVVKPNRPTHVELFRMSCNAEFLDSAR